MTFQRSLFVNLAVSVILMSTMPMLMLLDFQRIRLSALLQAPVAPYCAQLVGDHDEEQEDDADGQKHRGAECAVETILVGDETQQCAANAEHKDAADDGGKVE